MGARSRLVRTLALALFAIIGLADRCVGSGSLQGETPCLQVASDAALLSPLQAFP